MNQPALPSTIHCTLSPWLVVGKGAIGLLAASRWALAGQSVQLWLKTPSTLQLRFTSAQQEYPLIFSPALPHLYDKVLIPVKAYDVVRTVQQLRPVLSDNAQIVLCHNGMGTIEQVKPLLSEKQGLWFASTTHGAFKPSPHHLCHTGIGQTVLGPCNAAATNTHIGLELAQALGPLQQVGDITPFLWRKLAINAVINPLTAWLDCKNGELLKPIYQQQINDLVSEFIRVATLSGQQFTATEIHQQLQQVLTQTAENYSSMQQDVKQGRATELDAIQGFLFAKASAAGITLPAHQQLYQALTQK